MFEIDLRGVNPVASKPPGGVGALKTEVEKVSL
jgi:hypothetical protein